MKRSFLLSLGFLSLLLFLSPLTACQSGSVRESPNTGPLGPQSSKGRGEQRVLMAAVRFHDAEPGFSPDRIRKKVVDDLDRYVREQSYGRAWVKADFRGWVNLPDPLSAYNVSPYNFQVDRKRVRKLIEDTMSALEGQVEFSAYDHILIIPGVTTQPGKGYGMLCYCANPGMLSGVRADPAFLTLRSRSGKEFGGGVFVGAENAHLGMFAHDFFHALGGVQGKKRLAPCLYDYERQSDASKSPTPEHHAIYIGPWDIMSEHFVKRNEPPPGVCSFTKIRLGWISPGETVCLNAGETSCTFLSPLEMRDENHPLVVRIALGGGRHYLLENRQRIGSDRVLQDSGLLILKVDPEVPEGSGTVRIMSADPGDPRFQRPAYRIEEEGKNLFEDRKNNVAVIPLWGEGDRLGVLVTTPEKSREALGAALKIHKARNGVSGQRGQGAKLLEQATLAFQRFDFQTAARLADPAAK